MRTRAIFLASVLAVVFPLAGNAQCKDGVVATWKLVSVTAKTDKGDADKAVLGQTFEASHLHRGRQNDGDYF